MDRYYESIREDHFPEFKGYVLGLTVEGRPAADILREASELAVCAVGKSDEPSYWEGITRHQQGLLRLHESYVQGLLSEIHPSDLSIWDFVEKHGWRRFRFSHLVLRMRMRIDEEDWTITVIPNYRPHALQKLKDMAAPEGLHAVIDAVEMNHVLAHGNPKKTRFMLQEKVEDPLAARHILWGNPADPQFLKLRLKNTNSTMHVSDWTLPLRS